jgi:hypothetical protein
MVSPTRVGVIAWALLVAVFVTTVTLSSGSSSTPQFATRSKYHKHNNHRTTKMGLNETSGRSNMNGPKRGAGNVLDSEYYGSDDNDNSACGLYVWDFFSATKYHMCRKAMRDCVYEGRGGKKFIRVKRRSLLGALYPCDKHSSDRCIFCHQPSLAHRRKLIKPNGGNTTMIKEGGGGGDRDRDDFEQQNKQSQRRTPTTRRNR